MPDSMDYLYWYYLGKLYHSAMSSRVSTNACRELTKTGVDEVYCYNDIYKKPWSVLLDEGRLCRRLAPKYVPVDVLQLHIKQYKKEDYQLFVNEETTVYPEIQAAALALVMEREPKIPHKD